MGYLSEGVRAVVAGVLCGVMVGQPVLAAVPVGQTGQAGGTMQGQARCSMR